MSQITRALSALRKMLRLAAKDPLWAITSLVLLPLRSVMPILRGLALFGIVAFAVGVGSQLTFNAFGIADGIIAFLWMRMILPVFLLGLLFRLVSNPLILHFGGSDTDTHGSARFATNREIAPLTRPSAGLLIGRDIRTGRLLRYDGPAHLLTMAPTRTGKGVGTIIPNLLTSDRSIICIDPKGENARVTRRARQNIGPVFILDPFSAAGSSSAAFNPLDGLRPDSPDIADDVSTLAEALVFDEPGMAGEAHWNEEAKALIAGLILMITASEPPALRHLATLRHYLTLAPETFTALLHSMQESRSANALIARAANRHLGKSDREAAGVLSSCQRHTHFLDSPRITKALERSDFRFADLKDHHATVFLVLPPDRLASYSRWLRLLVSQSLTEMARAPGKPDQPVLYLLDEFAALGHLVPVERAMGLMAGYGVQLWPILQDIHQLRATYGRRAGTFLSNAGVLQVFGVNDHDSARLVSDLLGQETIVFQSMGRALDSEKSGISFSEQHTGRSLLTPDEVRTLPRHRQLLFLAGQRPIIANKLVYHDDPEFRGLFEPDAR